MTTAAPRFDLPSIDERTQPWWDAAKEEKLLLQRCGACGNVFFYPRPFCPTCWSDDVSWLEASGRGTLYTYSIVYSNDLPPFKERLPYVAAIVDLEEGPRMMANIVDTPHEDLRVGMPLQVTFTQLTDELKLPNWTAA